MIETRIDYFNSRLPSDFFKTFKLSIFKGRKSKSVSKITMENKEAHRNLNSQKSFNFKLEPTFKSSCFAEWKFPGRNFEGRTQHSAVIYKKDNIFFYKKGTLVEPEIGIYIYGGKNSVSILSDFLKISFDPLPTWEVITTENSPGPLCCHKAIIFNDKMYVFGGRRETQITSDIFYFSFEINKWAKIKNKNSVRPEPEPFESFSLNLDINKKAAVFFGGYGKNNEFSNEVFYYFFEENKWVKIKTGKKKPDARAGHAGAIYKNNLYIFGGSDFNEKFCDMWCFNLDTNQWSELESFTEPRVNHTMNAVDNKLIIFGGTQSLVHEKNDILIYDCDQKNWKKIPLENEIEILPKLEKQMTKLPLSKTLKPKNFLPFLSHSSTKANINTYVSSPNISLHKISENEGENTKGSTRKGLATLSKKDNRLYKSRSVSKINGLHYSGSKLSSISNDNAFNSQKVVETKKKLLLSAFDIPDIKIRQEMMAMTPTTEVMRYAIEIFKAKQRNLEKSENNSNNKTSKKSVTLLPEKSKIFKRTAKMEGFFPCPRDGHTTLLTNDSQTLIIVGGDRFQIQFNDVFSCDLKEFID